MEKSMNELLFGKTENRLEQLMKQNNYTLKKVSNDTGIPVTTLSGYKKNLRTPKKGNAIKLADYFGVSIPYLLGVDDEPTNNDLTDNNIFSKLVIEKGKTLKEISEETGIGYSTIGNYNQGSRIPKTENAFILADYFGVSVAYLLGLESMDSKRDNQIPRPIPFYNDLNLMLSEFKDSQVIESYIDFISKDKKYNPILLKAFKQFIVDEEGYFLTLISESSEKNSPYHYIWEEWNKEKNKKS